MKAQLKAERFDRKFDDGDDVIEHLDVSKARRVNIEPRRVNVDFPTWVVEALDREAQTLGVTRQSLIKLWIAERLG
jgi:CopG antitoxin of type II toxin-antitoxin system